MGVSIFTSNGRSKSCHARDEHESKNCDLHLVDAAEVPTSISSCL